MSQIKQHSANGRNYTIVQVPKDVDTPFLTEGYLRYHYAFEHMAKYKTGKVELPIVNLGDRYNYRILFIAEEATEEQAEDIVECISQPTGGDDYYAYFRNYEGSQEESEWPWFNEVGKGSIKSLQSLIRSLFPNWADYKHVILERHD